MYRFLATGCNINEYHCDHWSSIPVVGWNIPKKCFYTAYWTITYIYIYNNRTIFTLLKQNLHGNSNVLKDFNKIASFLQFTSFFKIYRPLRDIFKILNNIVYEVKS